LSIYSFQIPKADIFHHVEIAATAPELKPGFILIPISDHRAIFPTVSIWCKLVATKNTPLLKRSFRF
jgi:hypothetical protein